MPSHARSRSAMCVVVCMRQDAVHPAADQPSSFAPSRGRSMRPRIAPGASLWRMLSHTRARGGLTLVELCLVLTIIGLVTTIAVRQLGLYVDRAAAHAAVLEAAGLVARARDEAVAQRALTSVRFDTVTDALELRMRGAARERTAPRMRSSRASV